MDEFVISKESQTQLLRLARETIEQGDKEQGLTFPQDCDPMFREFKAVFVTLTIQGHLRGCIGTIEPHLPLWHAVKQYAIAAANSDPRFEAVSASEMAGMRIEISVLSPLQRVKGPDEIIPGKHGVIVSYCGHSGLFLPQVWDQLPDKTQFLSQLCAEKAALPYNAWQDPNVEIYTFTVFAFKEEA